MVGDVPSIRSFWEIFSKFSNFLRSLVLIQSTTREASHSHFGYNNLVTIHFWWRETVLKHEKVYKNFVHECLKIFILVFTSFKVHGNSKSDHFLVEKKRSLFHKYCPAALGMAKVQNSGFWNISNLGLCCRSVALNTSFKRE